MKYYCVAIGDYEKIVDITLQKFMKSSVPLSLLHSPLNLNYRNKC